jgi:hypothetical protein
LFVPFAIGHMEWRTARGNFLEKSGVVLWGSSTPAKQARKVRFFRTGRRMAAKGAACALLPTFRGA